MDKSNLSTIQKIEEELQICIDLVFLIQVGCYADSSSSILLSPNRILERELIRIKNNLNELIKLENH